MEINGKSAVCGLIGDPVEHTLSPLIHNTLSEKMGINLVYVPFRVDGDRVEEAIKGAHALSIKGLNITVPHKSAVIPYLKEIDSLAEKIGAVNTLVRCEGGFKGYNTDMPGLFRALESEGITLKGKQVILLGAGGASRAVAFMCAEYGSRKVFILNRSVDKAEAVAAEVNNSFGKNVCEAMALSDYKKLKPLAEQEKFLCIQGTSVGLSPRDDEVVISESDFYEMIETGFDLIYKPQVTRFMKLVREAGGLAYNGQKMLLYQGIIAYELWNKISVPDEVSNEILEKMRANN